MYLLAAIITCTSQITVGHHFVGAVRIPLLSYPIRLPAKYFFGGTNEKRTVIFRLFPTIFEKEHSFRFGHIFPRKHYLTDLLKLVPCFLPNGVSLHEFFVQLSEKCCPPLEIGPFNPS
jgi:hypothetical protein